MTHRLIVNGELVLYGPVGLFDYWDQTGFTAADVLNALAEMDGDITVRLNSGGGIAMEGSAIFNALKRHDGAVSVIIDGIAASAASVIAMAGDTISMPSGSLMMIHEPSGLTWGTADDHRKTANVLDTMTGVFASLYAERTGLAEEEVRAMMKEETWLSPQMAVEKGFATAADEGEAATADAGFDYSTYHKAPRELVALSQDRRSNGRPLMAVASAARPTMDTKETLMSNKPKTAADPVKDSVVPNPVDPAVGDLAEMQASTSDLQKIYNSCDAAKMTLKQANEIVARSKGNFAEAQTMIINHLADRDLEINGPVTNRATVTADLRDRYNEGVALALMAKAGLEGGERNEFSSYTLMDIAREAIANAGYKSKVTDRMTLAGMALGMPNYIMSAGMHSTSDFVEILANVANKAMLKGYLEADETFEQWTARGTLSDFKPTKRIDLNLFPSLSEVPEGAEYSYATIGERAESIQLASYGKMFAITRQAIINDDMSVFTRIPGRMGRAARRTIANMVWAVITDNGLMSDGVALFHATHKNLGSGALTTANVDALRVLMAKQQDPDGHAAALNIRPRFLLVPVAKEGVARQVMAAEFEVGGADKRSPNYVRDMATVIADARLDANSADAWYMAADPMVHDTIEVSYLDGNSEPVLEERAGWNVDGVEMKVRIDAGVKALDFRGLAKSTGA